MCMDDKNLNKIEECETAREMWVKLEAAHTKMDGYHAIGLLRGYVTDKKKVDEKIDDYIYRKCDTMKKLNKYGMAINEKMNMGVILIGLPSEFDAILRTININDDKLTTDDLRSRIKDEEQLNLERNRDTATAYETEAKRKHSPTRNEVDKTNNTTWKPNATGIRCYRCQKHGHIGRNCDLYGDHLKRSDNQKTSNGRNHTRDRPRYPKEEKKQTTSYCINMTQSINVDDNNVWILDSGATDHMTKDNKKLNKTERCNELKIHCANGETVSCNSRGEINTRWQDENGGKSIKLTDVLYVKGLKTNLLSLSKLCKNGAYCIANNESISVYDKNNDIILIGKKINGLYCVFEEISRTYVSRNESKNLWHKRLGHPNKGEMERLKKIYSFDEKYIDCDTCNECKMRRVPFNKRSESRKNKCLDLIHSDIMGPIQPSSIGKNRYVITFTDDYSRYATIYLLSHKSEALNAFKTYKSYVENKFDRKIKALRTDNGREYVNREFDEYLLKNGIERQLSTPYCPQQNGVAERLNQSLMNIVRCLLSESKLRGEFWGEAIMTACYTKNRQTTKANDGETPYKRWNGVDANIGHMRRFGCICWYYNDTVTQKWKPKGKKAVFIGYDHKSKAYRLWDTTLQQMVIKRHVKFDELTIPGETPLNKNETFEEHEKVYWNKQSIFDEDDSEEDVTVEKGEQLYDSTEVHHENHIETTQTETASEENDSTTDRADDVNDTTKMTRSGRIIRQPHRYCDYTKTSPTEWNMEPEPKSFAKAMQGTEKHEWQMAVNEEMQNLIENNTWEIVERPKDKKVLRTQWIFKIKRNELGKIVRYKARLVVLGNKEVKYEDYEKTFSPVVMRKTMRTLIAISVMRGWSIEHIDINAAYLNARIRSDTYIEIPEGYSDDTKYMRNFVCKLKKSMYGLHESGLSWNDELNGFLISNGLTRSKADPCVYFDTEKELIITTYVDDLVLHGNKVKINEIKRALSQRFKIRDLGEVKRLLSININRTCNGLTLDQTDYIQQVLLENGMSECKGVSTPMEPNAKYIKSASETDYDLKAKYQKLIGSLLYLSMNTRPDIAFATTYMSQFCTNPTTEHWSGLKRILRYLQATANLGIEYKRTDNKVEIFTDADWAGDKNDRRSFSGGVTCMSGGAVSWLCRKQRCAALSTAEAEFIALCESNKERKWLKNLLDEIGENLGDLILTIKMDNLAAKKIAENPITGERSKHIELRLFNIRDEITDKSLKLEYVTSEANTADAFTKSSGVTRLRTFREKMGMVPIKIETIQAEC